MCAAAQLMTRDMRKTEVVNGHVASWRSLVSRTSAGPGNCLGLRSFTTRAACDLIISQCALLSRHPPRPGPWYSGMVHATKIESQ